MMATALLLVLMAAATATDLRWHKIYNWLTYPAILAGLGLGAAGSIAIAMGGVAESQWRASGHATLGESALGLLVCGLVMLLCLVFFPVGGGDVKLMAALGAIAGPEDGITAMLWTFVLGGCAALIVLVWRVGPWRLISRAFRQVVYSLRIGGWSPLTPDERAQLQAPLFLAPCAMVAVIIVRFQLVEWLM